MELLLTTADVERVLTEPLAIIYKHSTTCGISARAHIEVERFVAEHPEQPFYKVEVLESRQVSDFIETKTGVRHESPQLLVVRDGDVVWHDSHGGVTAKAIAASLS